MPSLLAADFIWQKILNLSFERALLTTIYMFFPMTKPQGQADKSKLSLKLQLRFDFASKGCQDGQDCYFAPVARLVCSIDVGDEERGRARIISETIINGSKAVKTI